MDAKGAQGALLTAGVVGAIGVVGYLLVNLLKPATKAAKDVLGVANDVTATAKALADATRYSLTPGVGNGPISQPALQDRKPGLPVLKLALTQGPWQDNADFGLIAVTVARFRVTRSDNGQVVPATLIVKADDVFAAGFTGGERRFYYDPTSGDFEIRYQGAKAFSVRAENPAFNSSNTVQARYDQAVNK